MKSKKYLLVLISIFVLSMVTGCFSKGGSVAGTETEKPAETNNSAAPSPSSTGTGGAKIGGGGKLTMLFPALTTLDWRFGGWEPVYARKLFAEGLTLLDKDYKAIPGLAKEWSTNDNGKTWTFKLRDNLKWSNGEPLVAGDIVWAWRHTIDPKVWKTRNNTAWFVTSDVELVNQKDILADKKDTKELGVEAPDDKTVVVHLVKPLANFPEHAALNWGLVLHKSAAEPGAFAVDKIVVNGPYKPKELKVNEKLVLVPNDKYYADVTLDEITLKFTDTATNLPAYMNNELDIMEVGAPQLVAVQKDPKLSKELVMDAAAGFKVLTYLNNSKNTVLEDPRIGQALNMSIDKKLLAQTVSQNAVEPTDALITPMIDPNWPNKFTFDVAKAKQLLADAGFPDGKGLPTIQISVSHGAVVDPFVLGVKDQWEKNLGVKVNVDNIGDYGTWWGKINSPLPENYVGYVDDAYVPEYKSPIPLLTPNALDYYRKSIPGTYYEDYHKINQNKDLSVEKKLEQKQAHWAAHSTENGKKYKQLVDQIKAEADPNKQLELAKQADKIRLDSGLYIPLYSWKSLWLVKPTVKGYIPDKFFNGKPLYFNGITNVK